jgi:methylase of polypeptide subunit release factors
VRTLTLQGVEFLRSERGQQALAALGCLRRGDALSKLESLRNQGFAAEEASWLVDQAQLRAKAAGKLPNAEALLLTDEALQQASGLEVAGWRARRYAEFPRVLDLGAGVGGDTLALAAAGRRVVSVERDPVRAALLEHNVAAAGLSDRVEVQAKDWTQVAWQEPAAFADPARRVDGRRVISLHAMRPPLSAFQDLRRTVPDILVKVAPGLDLDEVPEDASLEFVSFRGELKEALLAFGSMRRAEARVAVVLPGPHELSHTGHLPARVSAPGAFLFEPDPAVIRAGLVRALGERLDAWQLDSRIAYLSGDVLVTTPFAKAWRVLRSGRFGRKELTRWLRDHGAGSVEIKKRGVHFDTESLARRLPKTSGGPKATVFLARTADGVLALLTERVA